MADPEDVAQYFPVDLNATHPVNLGLDGTQVYKVTETHLIPEGSPIGQPFIIDTNAGGTVACHPHIVGDELRALCFKAALKFTEAVESLGLIEASDAAILHILRAGAGYMVADAMHGVPVIDVRTEYRVGGYRDHPDDPRRLVVSYRHYPEDLRDVGSLIVPDTYASGRSAEAALLDLLGKGFSADRVILYGFIAIPALIRLGAVCESHDMDLYSFAICDITQLAHNNYDMCIYGPDESLYKEDGRLRALGSIVDRETLRRLHPHYIPGLDQPGDWSERQSSLFDGYNNESGDIRGHLEKSVGLVQTLRDMNRGQEWYSRVHDEAATKELKLLSETLKRYR